MLNTQELKASVAKLSAGDLNEFTQWFEEFIAQKLVQRESQRKLLELEGMIDWQGDFSVVSQWNDVCDVEPKTF